ncbi:MAG TPA: alkaline phosphatase family protein [Candidatus Hydrogenedentes bacterium]|nr:alkaline phosphatase family protein [Candidatus Hydrogenedentota bacterium]
MGRFLLIGLDGAEPSLTEQWMGEGHLPNLSRLSERGTYLPLASTCPPITFPAWNSCVTGVNPGRHGVFDFTELIRGTYQIRFLNSTFRKTPAIWNLASEAGKRVGILGVPGTYPPETVNGFMVSGFDSPVATRPERSCVFPPTLYPDVREWRYADFQEHHLGAGWHENALRSMLNTIEIKEKITCNLLSREPWDFFMVVFGESDTVAHHFWLFHDPASPRHCPGPAMAIRDIYMRLDAAVGRIIEAAGPEMTVGVVSDHGFGGAGDQVLHLNAWLAEHGYLAFHRPKNNLLKQLALTTIPTGVRGALFRHFQGMAARLESRSRFSAIDWTRTTAWSEELNYFPSIHVNLGGREPQGQVKPEEYAAFVQRLCGELESWEPVEHAWPRETLYHGPYVDHAPDVILELALKNSYSYTCRKSVPGNMPIQPLLPEERFGGKEHGTAGTHRGAGVVFLSEKSEAHAARIEDIAPTVLQTLGMEVPPMDGHSLLGRELPGDSIDHKMDSEQAYSAEEEAILAARLRALGYIE